MGNDEQFLVKGHKTPEWKHLGDKTTTRSTFGWTKVAFYFNGLLRMHTFAGILVRGFGGFDNRCSMQRERCAGVIYAVGGSQQQGA